MKKNKKDTLVRLSAVGLSVIATTALVAGVSYAYGGDFGKMRKNFSADDRETIENALKNGDYESWKSIMGDKRKINEEKFSQMIEMRELMRSDDFEAIAEIKESMGLPEKESARHNFGMRKQVSMHNWQKMEDAREAIENNNYEAWREAIGEHPLAEKINEENFPKLVEAHNLMRSGNFEEAKEKREELGIPTGKFEFQKNKRMNQVQ